MCWTMNKFIFYALTCFLLLTGGCNKDEPADCGCGSGSEVVFTIEDSHEQTGYLYKTTGPENPNFPKYKFGLWFPDQGCSNCIHTFLVCNNSFFSNIDNIPAYPGIEVKFSGQAKNLCEDPPRLADYTYNHLILTRIELQ